MPSSNGIDVFNNLQNIAKNQNVFSIGSGGGAKGSSATIDVYYPKTSDETFGTTAPGTDLTELRFTPAANKTYLVEAWIYTTTGLTTNAVQWAIVPTVAGDVTDNVRMIYVPTSATVWTVTNLNTAQGLSQNTGASILAADQYGWALIKTAGSITGTIGIRALCATAGQTFTAKAGSFIRVREVA